MSEQLLKDVEAIKGAINGIRNTVKSLDAQYKQALFAITPDQANSIITENIELCGGYSFSLIPPRKQL